MNEHDEQPNDQERERERALPEHEYRKETRTAEGLADEQADDLRLEDDQSAIDPADEQPVAFKPRSG